DGDGIPDVLDNCPFVANPDQRDSDGDGIGDACEGAGFAGAGATTQQAATVCQDPPSVNADADADGFDNAVDNCPETANDQADTDGDGIGDACDIVDHDGDLVPDSVDNCPNDPNPDQADDDLAGTSGYGIG